mgnify:FL=1
MSKLFTKRNKKNKNYWKKIIHTIFSKRKFMYELRKRKRHGISTGGKDKKYKDKYISKITPIDVPAILCFDKNLCETLDFFNEIRKVGDNNKRLFIEMRYLKDISPEAALVLVAELDRRCILSGKRIGVQSFNKWEIKIKTIFRDIGMYEFLHIELSRKQKLSNIHDDSNNIKFLKFRAGVDIDYGRKVEIIDDIKKLINNYEELNGRKTLKVGLTEAILNTHHHAYPSDFIENSIFKKPKWWVSACFDSNNNNMKLIVYDQGKTIPGTLDLKKYVVLNESDSEKLKTAVETSESSTKLANRGKGLKSIKQYAKNANNGELVIISKKGYYKYIKNTDTIKTFNMRLALEGTLISWNGCIESDIDIDKSLYKEN